MEQFSLDFLLWSGIFGGLVTPNVMNLFKNVGFYWPSWLKLGVSIVGAGLASFLAIGIAEGWTTEVVDFENFWQPLLAGMAITYPVQLTAWRNAWKSTKAGVALSALGQPKQPGE